MVSSIFAATLLAALAPQALAELFITAPVASTVCNAGQPCNVAWNDDGNQPSLSQIGVCQVGLYVGSQQQQIMLQDLGSVDVSQQATASFVPQADVGGNSNLYFIRFNSINLKEASGFPHQGFSAKFTLAGMTGTFNATEQSLMSAPTVPLGSSTPGATTTSPGATNTGSSSGVVTVTSTPGGSTTAKPTGSTTSHASSTSTTSKGAAAPVLGSSSHSVALAAVVVSAFFAAAAF